MALNVGELYATVEVITAPAERALLRFEARLKALSGEAEGASAGTVQLDRGLASVAATADKAGASMTRAQRATAKQAASDAKAATSAERHAQASARVAVVLNDVAAASRRERVEALRDLAAQERLTAVRAGSATEAGRLATATSRLASAEASAAASSARLARTHAATAATMATAGRKLTHSVTLPVVALAAISLKSASDFEQATNVYVTAAGESVKGLAKVRAGIKSTATETGTSIDNLTKAEYIVQKAGLHGAEGITALAAAAKGAREENADLTDVVQAETSVMASYHLGTDKAVQVINALKTGAGQAKVTMEDFAGSLSTVIPIASANHIALQEVLGAEATLTQHGTSAKEATQELASTIRSLAAPNRVAQAQMQQLHLSVNDVTTGIGKRGLTGTINLLVGAITKHMGPAGLVITNAMNQSASATHDAQVMIDAMPPSLAKLATAYRGGKISLGDWRDTLKTLPAPQAALLKQFATLSDKAHGFSQLLRSGDPAAQTFTSALKKIGGGSIGLNTILQLMGENMEGFQRRTDNVGKSLHDTSNDVEGWHSTAQLAAVRSAKLGAAFHVLAIDAGTALLPMLSKVVSVTTGIVHGFQGLSSTEKTVLGWSIGVVAALGPVMAIGSRIGLAAGGFAKYAGASEVMATRVAASAQRVSGALAGIGIAYAGMQTGGTGGHIMGALGGAIAGASVGSFFGPWGTAIGGAVGALGGLALSFAKSGDAGQSAGDKAAAGAERARRALQLQLQTVQGLTDAISADSDAIGRNTKAQVANDLQKSGALKLAQTANLNPLSVVNATTGDPKAQAALQRQIQKRLADAVSGPGGLLGNKQSAAIAKLIPLLRQEGALVGKGGRLADLMAEATGKVSFATRTAADQTRRYGATLDQTTNAGRQNLKFIHDHVTALNKERTSGKLTNQGWLKQIGTLQTQLKQFGFGSKEVAQYTAQFSHIPKSVATKLLADPKVANSAIGDVLRAILNLPAKKTTDLDAKDNTGPTLANLDVILGRTTRPRGISIYLEGQQALIDSLSRIKNVVDYLTTARSIDIGASGRGVGGLATGGGLPEGVSAVGERGTELVVKRGRDVQVISHPDSVPIARRMQASGITVPGFAAGTVAGTQSWMRSHDGDRYDFGATGPHAWDCSGFGGGALLHLLGHSAGGRIFSTSNEGSVLPGYGFKPGAGSGALMVLGWNDHHTTFSVGGLKGEAYGDQGVALKDQIRVGSSARDPRSFPHVMHLPKGAHGIEGGDPKMSGGTVNGTKYATALGYENAQARAKAARVKAAGATVSGVNKLGHTIAGNVSIVGGKAVNHAASSSDVQQQLWDMEAQLRAAGASRKWIKGLEDENKAILKHVALRNHAATRLLQANTKLLAAQKKLRDDRGAFKSAIYGTFDIASAGADDSGKVTGGRILSQQQQALTRALAFVHGIQRLRGKVNASYLRALAAKGPDALGEVNAILGMTHAQLHQLNVNDVELNRVAAVGGGAAAVKLDQGAVNQAAAAEKFWEKREHWRQKQENKALDALGDKIVDKLNDLHIAGPVRIDWRRGEMYLAVETDRKKSTGARGPAHRSGGRH